MFLIFLKSYPGEIGYVIIFLIKVTSVEPRCSKTCTSGLEASQGEKLILKYEEVATQNLYSNKCL